MPPANDLFVNAKAIAGPRGWLAFNNVGATIEAGESAVSVVNDDGSVWFKWTCPTSFIEGCTATFDTSASPYPPLFDSNITIFQAGSPDILANLVYNFAPSHGVYDDDSALQTGAPGIIGTSRASFSAEPGVTYYIRVGGWNPNATDATAVLRWSTAANTVTSWIQDTDKTISLHDPGGVIAGNYKSKADTFARALAGFYQNPDYGVAFNPYSPITIGGFAGDIWDGWLLYTSTGRVAGGGDPAVPPTIDAAFLHLFTDGRMIVNSVSDSLDSDPGGWIRLEYEDIGSFEGAPLTAVLLGDVSFTLKMTAQIWLTGVSFPSDLALELKELTAGMWTEGPAADPTPPEAHLTTTNLVNAPDGSGPYPWLQPADVSGLSTFLSHAMPTPGSSSSDTVVLPGGESRMFWFGASHFLSSEAADGFQYTLSTKIDFAYRPRRHRFVFAASPAALPIGPVFFSLPDESYAAEVRSEARLMPSIRMDGG